MKRLMLFLALSRPLGFQQALLVPSHNQQANLGPGLAVLIDYQSDAFGVADTVAWFPGSLSVEGGGVLAASAVDYQQAVLILSGASCLEELAEDELLRYQSLSSHPVDLNLAGRSRLLATGLLTPYQVASLLDYRERTGSVLSWSELALVDGFSAEFVSALREFAVLGVGSSRLGHEPPGHRESRRFSGSVTVRGAARASAAFSDLDDASWSGAGGVKVEASVGERAAVFFSARNTLSEQQIGSPTFSAAYYGRRALGQVIVGHFNARFGQGLVQWSGFQLSGYNSVGAFRRNGTGFSPTGSFSPSLLGIASDWYFGTWRLSAAYSVGSTWKDFGALFGGGSGGSGGLAGLWGGGMAGVFGGGMPILNLTRTWRSVTAGLTATASAASLEARLSLPSWSLFGEVACSYAGAVSAVGGAVYVPSYGHRLGLLARWYGPSDKRYSGLAVGYEGPSLSWTADAGLRTDTRAAQYKSVLQWKPEVDLSRSADASAEGAAVRLSPVPSTVTLRPSLRLAARLRPSDAASVLSSTLAAGPTAPGSVSVEGAAAPSSMDWDAWRREALRLEGRGTVVLELGPWTVGGRYDAVWGHGFAWSWYAEAGRKTERFALWARSGIFKVDDWDDRIYVYERDAPGSFTVPARYGRGWNASLYAAWQPSRHHSFWLRLETVQYPWNLTPKDGRLEARLQYRYKW